jgi:hypothetical protein
LVSEAEALAEEARAADTQSVLVWMFDSSGSAHAIPWLAAKLAGLVHFVPLLIRQRLRGVLRSLRALVARMFRQRPDAVTVGGSRHSPGRTLSVRPPRVGHDDGGASTRLWRECRGMSACRASQVPSS